MDWGELEWQGRDGAELEVAAGGGSTWNEGQSLGRDSLSSQPLQLCPEEQGEPAKGIAAFGAQALSGLQPVPCDEDEHWVVLGLGPGGAEPVPVGQRVIHSPEQCPESPLSPRCGEQSGQDHVPCRSWLTHRERRDGSVHQAQGLARQGHKNPEFSIAEG